jgi:hypothetical protein
MGQWQFRSVAVLFQLSERPSWDFSDGWRGGFLLQSDTRQTRPDEAGQADICWTPRWQLRYCFAARH